MQIAFDFWHRDMMHLVLEANAPHQRMRMMVLGKSFLVPPDPGDSAYRPAHTAMSAAGCADVRIAMCS